MREIFKSFTVPESYYLYEVWWYDRSKGKKWGIFSLMDSRNDVRVGNVVLPSAEHFYQILRLSNHADEQREVLKERNPLRFKWLVKGRIKNENINFDSHSWEEDKLILMYLTILIKIKSNKNIEKVVRDLKGDVIVYVSKKDSFWGAKPNKIYTRAEGSNVIGKLYSYMSKKLLEGKEVDSLIKELLEEEGELFERYGLFGRSLSSLLGFKLAKVA